MLDTDWLSGCDHVLVNVSTNNKRALNAFIIIIIVITKCLFNNT